jgi:hypothetical protein
VDAVQDSGSNKTATTATNADITAAQTTRGAIQSPSCAASRVIRKKPNTGRVQISLLPAMLETRGEVFSGGRCFFEVGTDRRFGLVELAGHRSSEIWLDDLLDFAGTTLSDNARSITFTSID